MSREEENREKAKELAIKYCKDIDPHGKEIYNIGCEIACCEMVEWADQHPREGLWDSEKVVEWILNNYGTYEQTYADVGGYIFSDFQIEQFIKDLRKAMEE